MWIYASTIDKSVSYPGKPIENLSPGHEIQTHEDGIKSAKDMDWSADAGFIQSTPESSDPDHAVDHLCSQFFFGYANDVKSTQLAGVPTKNLQRGLQSSVIGLLGFQKK